METTYISGISGRIARDLNRTPRWAQMQLRLAKQLGDKRVRKNGPREWQATEEWYHEFTQKYKDAN